MLVCKKVICAGIYFISNKLVLADALCRAGFYYPHYVNFIFPRSAAGVYRRVDSFIWPCAVEKRGAFLCLDYPRHAFAGAAVSDFYALPSVGITLDAFPAAVIGFTLNVGAFTSEVIRATLLSVAKGQWEAAHSIGMSWGQSLRYIILPQAARVAVPPLSNTFISLVKDTSLASVITVPELFLAAQRIAAVTYQPLILYSEAALLYLLISSVLSYLQSRLELRLERNTLVKEEHHDNAVRT